MSRIVDTAAALEEVVGARPLGSMLKSIDALDAHCVHLLRLSRLAVIGFTDTSGMARATTSGGEAGFVTVSTPKQLRLPLDAPLSLDAGVGCGLLFFVPGLGETLRVNGRATIVGTDLMVEVEEAFAHCAKALLRSSFWDATLEATALPAPSAGNEADWLARSPFVVLSSWDARGRADASPKGDPPGFVRFHDGQFVVPDRPGNRRTDTFHNVVEQPRVALLAFVPGSDALLEVSGRARLSTDPALLAGSVVAGKVPKIALLLEPRALRLTTSPALVRSRLWDTSLQVAPSELPDMAHVFIDHVKLNRTSGVAAATMRTLASKRIMSWALTEDYAKNRY